MPKGYGYGLGTFSTPQTLLLTFMVTQKPHFFFITKIDCFHHELDNFNSILRLGSDLVELEASRTLGKWGSYCFLEWLSLGSYLEAIFERIWVFTQPLVLEWNSELKDKERKASSSQICSLP